VSKHIVPGWVSNGPVQINVGRDLHIHGGCGGHAALPDDIAPPHHDYAPGIVYAIGRVCAALWTVATAFAVIVKWAMLASAWVTFTVLAGAFWLVCRTFDVLHWALRRTESIAGGGPTQLVYVPSFMPQPTMHQLGPGNPAELADLKQLETEYDHSS
jgi:hypothetical protein